MSEPQPGQSARMRQLGALTRLVRGLGRALDATEIYGPALNALEEVVGVERSAILVLDEGVAQFVASKGLSEAYRAAAAGHFPWDLGDPNPEPILVEDVARHDQHVTAAECGQPAVLQQPDDHQSRRSRAIASEPKLVADAQPGSRRPRCRHERLRRARRAERLPLAEARRTNGRIDLGVHAEHEEREDLFVVSGGGGHQQLPLGDRRNLHSVLLQREIAFTVYLPPVTLPD